MKKEYSYVDLNVKYYSNLKLNDEQEQGSLIFMFWRDGFDVTKPFTLTYKMNAIDVEGEGDGSVKYGINQRQFRWATENHLRSSSKRVGRIVYVTPDWDDAFTIRERVQSVVGDLVQRKLEGKPLDVPLDTIRGNSGRAVIPQGKFVTPSTEGFLTPYHGVNGVPVVDRRPRTKPTRGESEPTRHIRCC